VPATHAASHVQYYLLELEGRIAGRLLNYSGGLPQADQIASKSGGGATAQKYVGYTRYQDMILECRTGMSQDFYQWAASVSKKSYSRKSGAVIELDQSFKPLSRMEFYNALISSVVLPALDAGSNALGNLIVKIRPEYTRYKSPVEGQAGVGLAGHAKHWTVNNFMLQISGLEDACRSTRTVNSLSFGQSIVADTRNTIEPGQIQVSDLVVQIAALRAGPVYQWFNDYITKGSIGVESKKNGTVSYLTPNFSSSYFDVSLVGLTPVSMTGTLGHTTAPMTFSMACERMIFSPKASAS
jgi:phage tail-like protein